MPPDLGLARRLGAGLGTLALALSLVPASACKPGKNLAGAIAKNPSAADATGQSKCSVTQSQSKPLIIEWPSTERAALEARAGRSLVPVRYTGCEMEILTSCTVEGQYEYVGTTPREDSVSIRDFDELYANLPLGAAKFEAKLEKTGSLRIDMIIAGRKEASKFEFSEYDIAGARELCHDKATHIITGITLGAFQFSSGAAAEIGGGAEVGAVAGAGAKSSSDKEILSKGGDFDACRQSVSGQSAAPMRCDELLRVEVVPIAFTNRASTTPAETTSAGALGLRDDTGEEASGWTPQLERKRKVWTGLTYVGLTGFLLGGVATIVGLVLNARAQGSLADVGIDGDPTSVAETGDARTKAIRQAQIGKPMLLTGYITLAVGGVLATIALPVAQKLKKQKQAVQASIAPMLTRGGGGAGLRVRF